MSANIDMSNGRHNFAYTGNANAVWWGPPKANEMQSGASMEAWLAMSGLGFDVTKWDAIARDTSGTCIDTGQYFNVREDTGAVLSRSLSERFVNYQPRDMVTGVWNFVLPTVGAGMSAMGSLAGGRRVFCCVKIATVTIAGDRHDVYLLAHTSFDGSAATTWSLSVVRTVCQNTVYAALAGAGAMVKIFHSQRVVAEEVAKQLAAMAQATQKYKAVGDAMAQVHIAKEATAKLFRKLLSIPDDVQKLDELSTRKQNQYLDLRRAYETSVTEGAERGSVWATWNAITRYVDHDKDARNQNTADASEARFYAAQFGNGAAMKQEAFNLLMPLIRDKVVA